MQLLHMYVHVSNYIHNYAEMCTHIRKCLTNIIINYYIHTSSRSISLYNIQLTTKSFHHPSIWLLSSCKFSTQYISTTNQ